MARIINYLSVFHKISIVEAREEYEMILYDVIEFIDCGDLESAEEILFEIGLSSECIEILSNWD